VLGQERPHTRPVGVGLGWQIEIHPSGLGHTAPSRPPDSWDDQV
jgi:hypothetical protein